jgi:hypothetical protein
MRITLHNPVPRRHRLRALTVIELLVSVAVMTVIVYGLYAMFSHTQKALRSSVNQVDVFDAGRAASDMITREMAEMSASNLRDQVNLQAVRTVAPIYQTDADGKTPLRTNVLQEVFFLSKFKNDWTGTGYRIMEAVDGVGTLYRYSTTANVHQFGTNNLLLRFEATGLDPRTGTVSTNLHRVADGIIHFRILAFDSTGRKLDALWPNAFTNQARIVLKPSDRVLPLNSGVTVFVRPDVGGGHPNQTEFFFTGTTLPSYVELDLGVLEPETFRQYLSVRGTAVAADFLRKRANKVHLFRERIPIRTAGK